MTLLAAAKALFISGLSRLRCIALQEQWRENTEDLYAGKELEIAKGVTQSMKIVTTAASDRVAKFAFQYALENKRKKVTVLHKANIMKLTDGLFLHNIVLVFTETR